MINITYVEINKFNTDLKTETGKNWARIQWTIDKLSLEKGIDVNISDMLENLRTVAEKYNHFID